MGSVYRAAHEELDLPVAIKLLKEGRDSTANVERLRREARALAKLRGRHVVHVFDTGEDPQAGRFIVMELVAGRSLADVLSVEGPLDPHRAIAIAMQICAALGEAHTAGIVHRDVKPANVLLIQDDDGTERVKVTDFGIAKAAELPPDLTDSAALLGSPKYMSPEQIVAPHDVDARTDIWSLGAMMFEMLTGLLPFEAFTSGGLLSS
ncbi:MAG TPA: serine/threonine-protein kinase, partial [Labilithrix sp.]|nr:serine/threonine-protein kinase [Labilithrix sp.]